MIRKIAIVATLAAFTLTGTACNTVKGLGRDIESVGRTGEEVISYTPRPNEQQDAQVTR